jgi:hypothetical protein
MRLSRRRSSLARTGWRATCKRDDLQRCIRLDASHPLCDSGGMAAHLLATFHISKAGGAQARLRGDYHTSTRSHLTLLTELRSQQTLAESTREPWHPSYTSCVWSGAQKLPVRPGHGGGVIFAAMSRADSGPGSLIVTFGMPGDHSHAELLPLVMARFFHLSTNHASARFGLLPRTPMQSPVPCW